VSGHAVDIVGTGGDLAHTVNITTMAALVSPAPDGGRQARQPQRVLAMWSADVLEELGVVIDLDAAGVAATTAEVGHRLLLAPVSIPGCATPGRHGVRSASRPCSTCSVRDQPARPRASAVGCADRRMAPLMAKVFARRGDTALVSAAMTAWTSSRPPRRRVCG